mmetsp:Transcript_4252/g.8319  ORF Transcript_4252/g.8319 Transcript_4252/m.8319 type:complete len:86 (-) Transcript_4252:1751-2008(-)
MSDADVERKEHGINDGSGKQCHDHSYTIIDDSASKRIESLSKLLSETYGVRDGRLVTALCALGEGEFFVFTIGLGLIKSCSAFFL